MRLTTQKSGNEGKKRISANLSNDSVNKLKMMAEQKSVTASSVLASAIETEAYIRNELRAGSKLLIQAPDGSIRELVFR